jgi:hypothetical protein
MPDLPLSFIRCPIPGKSCFKNRQIFRLNKAIFDPLPNPVLGHYYVLVDLNTNGSGIFSAPDAPVVLILLVSGT